jgi:hypothetical protein
MAQHLRGLPWPGLILDAALLAAAYLAYSFVRLLVEGAYTDAVNHSLHVINLERALGLYHEVSVQKAVAAQPWLAAIMEFMYRFVYFPFLVVASVIVLIKDQRLYRAYRNAIFLSLLIGLVCFALLPVAPPRMLPEFGFFDPIHDGRIVQGSRNDYAAVPSFHFGFTLIAALSIAHAWRFNPWMCVALALVPTLMLFSIVATANHFFIDALAGGAVVMFGWWIFVYHRPRPTEDASNRSARRRPREAGLQSTA